MNFDELQQTWQSQPPASDPQGAVDVDLLLREVKRNQQQFSSQLFWRDIREIGASVILAVWSCWWELKSHEKLHFLMTALAVYCGAFMLIYRRRGPRPPSPEETLRTHVQAALDQVKDQVWLLKNVGWWGLLPMFLVITTFTVVPAWQRKRAVNDPLWPVILVWMTCVAFLWFVYWLNQRAVRKDLEPRQRELEMLLKNLQPDPVTAQVRPE